MPAADQVVRTYSELAEIYHLQAQAPLRDRYLVLSADAAGAAGQWDEAERLRQSLLQLNPHHLLKPYDSFAEAMESTDIRNYLTALRRSHPYEKAEHLLESLRQKQGAEVAGRLHFLKPVSGSSQNNLRKAESSVEVPDEPQVYRLQHAEGEQQNGPRPAKITAAYAEFEAKAHPPFSKPPASRPVSSAPSQRTGGANPAKDMYALRWGPHALPALPSGAESEEGESGAGGWVSYVLFVMVLLVSVLLGAYTFVRPFLAPERLP